MFQLQSCANLNYKVAQSNYKVAQKLQSSAKIIKLRRTASFNLLKSTGTGINLSTSNLLFKLLKLVGIFFNLSISNLYTSDLDTYSHTWIR